ncbi:MAG TPA: hypothetical protein VK666_00310 [Chryseolinea sp.]|nr:hypothetical protein [Chryseolinea sp.]
MKCFGILHLFLLLLLLLSYIWADGQDYVVTSKGDTIIGTIKPLMYGADKKVQVAAEGKKKQTLAMFQIRAFQFKNETYQPVKGPDGYTFMKLIKSGYLSLYHYQLLNQVTFDGTFLLRRDGKGIDVPNLGFKKVMKNFLEDCESVADKIDKGDLSKRDLNTIIDEYNQCIQNKTINHDEIVAAHAEQQKQISAWDVLEQKVKDQSAFEGKENALEMIGEIKGKIAKSEKIPNFLVEGLKSSLNQDTFKAELDNALKEIQ